MHDNSHRRLVLRAVIVLSKGGPVSVREITAEAVRIGLVTQDRRGTAHRVRTELQTLKRQTSVVHSGRDRWQSRIAAHRGRTPDLERLEAGLSADAGRQRKIAREWDCTTGDGLGD